MSDHILIYFIVILNILCQITLIWRQRIAINAKWIFCIVAVSFPLVTMLSMRLLIANGVIECHVATQSLFEHFITSGASILIIAGPWMVTIGAIVFNKRNRILLKKDSSSS